MIITAVTVGACLVGALAATLAFASTRGGTLNLGAGITLLLRGLVAFAVLAGFVSLGYYLDGYEEIGGGRNPWWVCLVFWAQAGFGAYSLFEGRLCRSGSER